MFGEEMTVRSDRPASLLAAAGLLLIIGLSGLSVGISLILAMRSARDVPWVGVEIGAAIGGYGVLTMVAGIGLLARRRPAWWLGIVAIGAGWLFLVGLVVAVGSFDPVFGFGILVWSVTFACLLAEATRAAIGVGLRR